MKLKIRSSIFRSQVIRKKIAKGKSVEQIAEELEEELDFIRPMYEELVAENKHTKEYFQNNDIKNME